MMTLEARFQDDVFVVETAAETVSVTGGADEGATRFVVEPLGDHAFRVSLTPSGSSAARSSVAVAVRDGDAAWVFVDGDVVLLELQTSQRRRARRSGSTHETLTTPMPATVVRLFVAPGDRVTKSMPLAILEAMKMELPLRAPRDGVVRSVTCREGDLVQPGPPLIELEPLRTET
jgi:biotin carboxyl carrier protein